LTHTNGGDPVQVEQAYKSPGGLVVATIEIPLTQGYVARIDEADRAFTDGRKWHARARPTRRAVYAMTKIDGRGIFLHNLLCPDWKFVDHKDGDGLNNRRSNLRDGTEFRNGANRWLFRNNTSGYKGVTRAPKGEGRWTAAIGFNRRLINLGTYDSPEEAAYAYDQAAVSYFGEWARTNAMLGLATVAPTRPRLRRPSERTHCVAGHEFTPENTFITPRGTRVCRICRKRRHDEHRERERQRKREAA
jgi:AP2 domain